jgi:acyl-CoA synthetase (NDP forming)
MVENAQRHGLQVPILADETQDRLGAILPSYLGRSNPVDNGMRFLLQASLEDRLEVLCSIADDPEIDVIVAGNNMGEGPVAEAFVEDLISYVALDHPVPIVCVWGAPGDNLDLFARLSAAEIPILRSSRAAMRSLKALHDYSSRRRPSWPAATPPRSEVMRMLDDQSGVLSEELARHLLHFAGIPTCEEYLVRSAQEAAESWKKINASAVMKVASPDFPHRSDYGLVRCGVSDATDAAAVFAELVEKATALRATASIDGVVIQREVQGDAEILIGTVVDPVIGPAVTVGFGGVLAEVLADTAVRPLPLTDADALDMLRSLRGFNILEGVRGSSPVDVDAIVAVITAVALLMSSSDGRLAELEVNPLIVSSAGAVAVDVLAVAAGRAARDSDV